MKKRNLLHIDEIRFFMIHLVVVDHWSLNLYISKVPVNQSLINFWFDWTSSTLAIISGYLFFYRTSEQFNYRKKALSRIPSLVVPYLFWTISFYLIYYVLKEEYAKLFHSTAWYEPIHPINLKSFIDSIVHPPLVNLWYLQNLILIIPFNFIIYYIIKNRFLFGAVFLAIMLNNSFHFVDLFFQARFLPYYLLGCFLGYREVSVPKVHFNKLVSILIIPLLLIVGAKLTGDEQLVYTSTKVCLENLLFLSVKVCFVGVLLFSLYNFMDSNPDGFLMKYLKKYKAHSFFLFAINMFLFSAVERTLLKVGAERYLSNAWFTLFFLIISMVLVLILAFSIGGFLRKHCTRFYHIITGR